MSLVRWSPTRDLVSIQDELNRFFDSFFGLTRKGDDFDDIHWVPRVNIEEAEDRFELTADLPGMDKDDIKIEVRDHTLTISGERKLEEEKKDKNFHLFERSYGQFSRSFSLPDNVDADKIEAEFTNGVLRLDIPKAEKAKAKEIKVKVK
ncbi:MAG: hypothetical protein B6D63_04060 [Candidatus Latescibacteria bacterium 4484_7]|nr:MAG: hypothetical protein B6D63_04060 [Candidatus Latescibacteria bacterium 4484_7]